MKHFSFALIFYLLLSLPSFAQVQINWPEDGLVFQRNKPGTSLTTQVYFVISSTNGTPINSAAVKFEILDLNGNTGSTVDPSTGVATGTFTGISGMTGQGTCQIRGYFNIRAGMYRITARLNNANNSGTTTIGVGEVFAIAGQSNAAGYAKDLTNYPAASYSNAAYVRYNNKKAQFDGDDPGGLQGGGNKEFIWYWGRVGQKLVDYFVQSESKYVPVAFYQAAWSGSGIDDWRLSLLTGHSPRYTGSHDGYPAENLKKIIGSGLDSYMSKVGIRGILWHQGEYDNLVNPKTTDFDSKLDDIVVFSRSASIANQANLAWVIARVTYVNGAVDPRNPSIVDAQNNVIGYKSGGGVKAFGDPIGSGNDVKKNYRYTGPNTDELGSSYRIHEPVVGYTHFNSSGQIAVADKWIEALTQTNGGNNFFNSSIPVINNPATAVANGGTCNPDLQPCACGFTLEGASQIVNQYKVNFIFNSCNAAKLRWYIYAGSNTNGTLVATDTLSPDKGSIDINVPTTMATGTYTIKVTALDCIGADDWTFNYTKPGGVNPPQLCNEIPTKNSGNDSEYADYTLTPGSTGSYYLQLTYASGEANPAGRVTVSGTTSNFTLLGTGGWTPNTTANITSKTLTGNTPYTIRVAGMNGPPSHTFTHNKLCLVPCSGCRTGIEEASIAIKPEVDESKVFTVFPNPTSGSIKVKYYTEDERSVTIKLFDVSGRVLKEVKAQSIKGINESEFDITDLSDAPYILNLNDGVKEHSKQIIKIK